MPTIPMSEQSVRTQAPQVGTPHLATPNIMSNTVRGQSGEAVQEASQRLAGAVSDVGLTLSNIMAKHNENKAIVKSAEIENNFRQKAFDLKYSKDIVTKKDANGNDVSVVSGYALRSGEAARDSTGEYKSDLEKYRDEQLQNFPEGIHKEKLKENLRSVGLSELTSQIEHETTQVRAANRDKFKALSDTLSTSVRPDANSLSDTMTKIADNRHSEQRALGDSNEEAALKIHDDVAKAAFNAANSVLRTGGTLEQATAILNDAKVKDNIPIDTYEKVTTDLETSAKRIQGLQDWQIKLDKTQTAFDLSKGLQDGSLTPQTLRVLQSSGKIDAETFAIYDSVLRDIPVPIPTEAGKPDAFINLLNTVLTTEQGAEKQKDVQQILKDVTTAYGRKEFGANQYAYFIAEANKQFERDRQGLKGDSPVQSVMKSALKGILSTALTMFGNDASGKKPTADMVYSFMERTKKGEDPTKVMNEIQWEHSKKVNNTLNTLSPDGEILTDRFGNQALCVPGQAPKPINVKGKKESKQ